MITDIPCYLIGQLARNDGVTHDQLAGCDLIEEAHRIIMESVNSVGGRIMMIECRNEQKLLNFYHDNGFNEVSNEADGDDMGITSSHYSYRDYYSTVIKFLPQRNPYFSFPHILP